MNQLTEYRREFHKYPENGWREFRTSARVAEILTGMGYDVAMGPDVIEPGAEPSGDGASRPAGSRSGICEADPGLARRDGGAGHRKGGACLRDAV